jgi:hypothetical protein
MRNKFSILSVLLAFLFQLNAQERIVLLEQFSNSSCPPCAQSSPQVYNYANNNPEKAVAIAYHTGFPYSNDSMYLENPVEANQRVNFYSIGGVPHTIMDGNVFNGGTNSFLNNINSNINNRMAVNSQYTITTTGVSLSNNQLSGTFQFNSLSATNADENLIAHLVVIEKNVLKSSYASSPGNNSQTQYGYVMRKMLPNANGTALINKDLNGTDEINFNWTIANIKNESEIRIVAFVQNIDTKEVYQSQLFEVNNETVGFANTSSQYNEIHIFPNPSNGSFSLVLNQDVFVETLTIVNQLGQAVINQVIEANSANIQKSFQLERGIYFVKLRTITGELTKKIIII